MEGVMLWEQDVAGSNPAAPTSNIRTKKQLRETCQSNGCADRILFRSGYTWKLALLIAEALISMGHTVDFERIEQVRMDKRWPTLWKKQLKN
jgi:hypothetical protein